MRIPDDIEKTLAPEKKNIWINQRELELMVLIQRELNEWLSTDYVRNNINRQRDENTRRH